MPCFVTTQVGEKLSDIVGQYGNMTNYTSTKTIEEVANLNQVSAKNILPPYKIIVLPDGSSNDMCSVLDHQAVALAKSMEKSEYDPLKTLLQTGWGNELLASLEIVESLQANDKVKAVFGGALGASGHLYNQFLRASDDYKKLLKNYASASGSQRNALKKQIATAARTVEEQYQKVVAVFVNNRRSSLPKRWKEVPHVNMYHVKNRGRKATIFKDAKEITRIRYAAASARVLGGGAFLLDVVLAGKNIKQAYDTDGNTTRVAFEEVGGITFEAGFAYGGMQLASIGVAAAGAFFPFLLIPGVGLLIVIGVAGLSALTGNVIGKKLGRSLYENIDIMNPLNQGVLVDGLNAL